MIHIGIQKHSRSNAPTERGPARARFAGRVLLFYGLVVILLLLAVWMRLHTLDLPFDRDSYDEGVYWQSLRAMAAGSPLYQRIFYSQPPFFLQAVYPIYLLFGQSLWSARLGVVLVSLCGLPGAFLLGKAVRGPIGGLTALLLLLTNPLYLSASQTLQADGPATALVLLAVGLAYLWERHPGGVKGHSLAALTGLVLALAIGSKLFAVAGLVPVGLLALLYIWRRWQHARKLRLSDISSLLIGLGVLVCTLVLLCLPYAGAFPALWKQVVLFHTDAKEHLLYTQGSNRVLLRQAVFTLSGGLALLGGLVALLRHDWRVVPLWAWLMTTLYLLWQQVPLFSHHMVTLVPPVIALIVMGIGPLNGRWREMTMRGVSAQKETTDRRGEITDGGGETTDAINRVRILRVINHRGIWGWFVIVVTVCALGGMLVLGMSDVVQVQQYYRAAEGSATSASTEQALRVARDLEKVTQPQQFVVSDAQFVVALAQRDTPASLVDTSNVRIDTGYVTTQELIRETMQDRVHAVLFYSGRLVQLHDFYAWVEKHFRLHTNYGNGKELWVKIE